MKSPRSIVLDVPNGKMYWADLGASKIQRANLDDSDVEDLITDLLGPNGIALDVDGNKIYWADEFSGKIQCANLNGSHRKTLFIRYGKLIGTAINSPLDILGLKIYYAHSPIGIALDISGGKYIGQFHIDLRFSVPTSMVPILKMLSPTVYSLSALRWLPCPSSSGKTWLFIPRMDFVNQFQPPRIAAIIRQPQPTINANPPMGVIAPSHRMPVRLST